MGPVLEQWHWYWVDMALTSTFLNFDKNIFNSFGMGWNMCWHSAGVLLATDSYTMCQLHKSLFPIILKAVNYQENGHVYIDWKVKCGLPWDDLNGNILIRNEEAGFAAAIALDWKDNRICVTDPRQILNAFLIIANCIEFFEPLDHSCSDVSPSILHFTYKLQSMRFLENSFMLCKDMDTCIYFVKI